MHVRVRVHDIRIYSDYTGRRYTPVDGTLSIQAWAENVLDVHFVKGINNMFGHQVSEN